MIHRLRRWRFLAGPDAQTLKLSTVWMRVERSKSRTASGEQQGAPVAVSGAVCWPTRGIRRDDSRHNPPIPRGKRECVDVEGGVSPGFGTDNPLVTYRAVSLCAGKAANAGLDEESDSPCRHFRRECPQIPGKTAYCRRRRRQGAPRARARFALCRGRRSGQQANDDYRRWKAPHAGTVTARLAVQSFRRSATLKYVPGLPNCPITVR